MIANVIGPKWLQVIVTTLLEQKDCQSKPRLMSARNLNDISQKMSLHESLLLVAQVAEMLWGIWSIKEVPLCYIYI